MSGFNAPIGSLSAKIALAAALGLISERERRECALIRRIRNKFAHHIHPGFDDNDIQSLSFELTFRVKPYGDVDVNAKGSVSSAAVALILSLTNRLHFVAGTRLKAVDWASQEWRSRSANAMRTILMAISATIMSLSAFDAIAASHPPMVRIAEIEVDPDQLDAYKALLAEEQEASVRLEPGVIMLHSVAIADRPTQIRLLEVYADRAAYEAHIRSPHFVKYKTSTEQMVKSLKLIEASPILLCAKIGKQAAGPTNPCR